MEQLFDDALQRDRGFTLLSSHRNPAWTPAIKIQETEAEIILQAEVPVVDAEALDVEVSHEAVSIVGAGCEKHTEAKRFFRPEFDHGQFQRIVRLPALIQNDQVKSEFKNGILTLTMPKLESNQKQAIKRNLADSCKFRVNPVN
jgi:HSP20 family protein